MLFLILLVATFAGCTSQIASPPGSSSNPVVPSTNTFTVNGTVAGGASGVYYISAFTSTSNVNAGTYAGGTTVNAGAFSFQVSAGGTYYINVYRDTNGNGTFQSGEPAVWYGGGYYANTSPTAVTTTTNVGTVTVISTFTVSGTVSGGTSGTYYVSAFTDTSSFIWAGGTSTASGTYSFFVPLTGANFYINAYRDTSGDGNYQGTEPSGWHGGTDATAIPVNNTTAGADFTVL
jgi:uncharacterized protein (DUF2141 family)